MWVIAKCSHDSSHLCLHTCLQCDFAILPKCIAPSPQISVALVICFDPRMHQKRYFVSWECILKQVLQFLLWFSCFPEIATLGNISLFKDKWCNGQTSQPMTSTTYWIMKKLFRSNLLVCLLSYVWFFDTSWTEALQAPLFVGFPSQEYWRELPFPPPGNLPSRVIKPASPASPAMAGGFFTTEPLGSPLRLNIPRETTRWLQLHERPKQEQRENYQLILATKFGETFVL